MHKELRGDFQAEAVLSSQGQITLPKELRQAMFLRQGDRVQFRVRNGEVTLVERAVEDADPVTEWLGALPSEIGPGGATAWVRRLRGYEMTMRPSTDLLG